METNMVIYFNSEGEKPSVIVEKIKKIGFKVQVGKYDFAYTWRKVPSAIEILNLADQVAECLKGCKVEFKLESL